MDNVVSYLLPAAAVLLVIAFLVWGILLRNKKALKSSVEATASAAAVAAAAALTSKGEMSSEGVKYMARHLGPESTHMDILLCIASAPENVFLTQVALDKIDVIRQERLEKESNKQQKLKGSTSDKSNAVMDAFDLDNGEWAEEDEDDEAHRAAKEEELTKAKEKAQLAEATGAADVLLEGLDDGVLGQKWVERTLQEKGHWPPSDLRFLAKETFDYKGKQVSALDHPAIRRNLCYTMGRINSIALNTHTELLEASSKKLIDQTYFKGSMEYRTRAGLLLESALRVSVSMQSYRLTKTVIETVAMFKIGINDPVGQKTLEWFKGVMVKQYSPAGIPKLSITDLKVSMEGEDEVATGDLAAITLQMERVHAEAFTRVKVAQCQAQGIPPQIALAAYREGWWVLVRLERLDGETPLIPPPKENPMIKLLEGSDLSKFEKELDGNRLVTAWPMVVQNMAQKSGKVKIQLKAPDVPGKYKVYLAVKSQEFLGVDLEFEIPVTIVDIKDVKRVPKETKDGEDDEAKKEK